MTSARAHQKRHIVRFAGVLDHASAEALRGLVLLAPPIDDPAALFVHELVGCELYEISGESHGKVAAVEQNPASDLLVGEAGWLVPLRFVVEHSPGRIVVDAPPGLFE